MSVDKSTSFAVVSKEVEGSVDLAARNGWDFSSIDEETQSFSVRMTSPIDNETYILRVQFDNYPQIPLLLEFIDPLDRSIGSKRAYPSGNDSFFHGLPCICNPCSRKSYRSHLPGAPHGDWDQKQWRSYDQVGTLTSIPRILSAIYTRISVPSMYRGRMA